MMECSRRQFLERSGFEGRAARETTIPTRTVKEHMIANATCLRGLLGEKT